MTFSSPQSHCSSLQSCILPRLQSSGLSKGRPPLIGVALVGLVRWPLCPPSGLHSCSGSADQPVLTVMSMCCASCLGCQAWLSRLGTVGRVLFTSSSLCSVVPSGIISNITSLQRFALTGSLARSLACRCNHWLTFEGTPVCPGLHLLYRVVCSVRPH